jgi:hypothetical protein
MTIIEARKALVKAIWSCIVDASSMNVVMSGPEVNAAMDAYRDAVITAERARIAATYRELRGYPSSGPGSGDEVLAIIERRGHYWDGVIRKDPPRDLTDEEHVAAGHYFRNDPDGGHWEALP